MTTIGTITILATRTVRQAIVGSKTLNLPEGTTDVNAVDVIRPYVPGNTWTWVYAGPKDNSTLVVAVVRGRRGELKEAFDRATKRAQKIADKING